MNKAILVIDMPDSCWDCSLIVEKENGCKMCPITNCTLISRDGKFPWCPLKPAPEKDKVYYLHEWSAGYKMGWNDCVNYLVDGTTTSIY